LIIFAKKYYSENKKSKDTLFSHLI